MLRRISQRVVQGALPQCPQGAAAFRWRSHAQKDFTRQPWTAQDKFSLTRETDDAFADWGSDTTDRFQSLQRSLLANDFLRSNTAEHLDFRSVPKAKEDASNTLAEAEELMRRVAARYSSPVFAWLLFESVDIVFALCQMGILDDSSTPAVGLWFRNCSAVSLTKRANPLAAEMGDERAAVVEPALSAMLAQHDGNPDATLLRVIRSLKCDPDQWIPFLRGLTLFGLSDADVSESIPTILRALVGGGVAEPVLPGSDPRERSQILMRLLLASAAEFGSIPFALLAMALGQQQGILPNVQDSKLAALAVSKNERRSRDWGLRRAGLLTSLVPQWRKVYYPRLIANRLTQMADRHSGSIDPSALTHPRLARELRTETSVEAQRELNRFADRLKEKKQRCRAARRRKASPEPSDEIEVPEYCPPEVLEAIRGLPDCPV